MFRYKKMIKEKTNNTKKLKFNNAKMIMTSKKTTLKNSLKIQNN